MRGIGIGQTIKLFIIPEVKQLIIRQMTAAQGPGGGGSAALVSAFTDNTVAGTERVLREVTGWLLINTMRSERTQFNMLSEQTLANAWRKRAFSSLLEKHNEVGSTVRSAVPTAPGQLTTAELLPKCLDVFRERLDYSVRNTVPVSVPFAIKLEKLLAANALFVSDDASKATVDLVRRWVTEKGDGKALPPPASPSAAASGAAAPPPPVAQRSMGACFFDMM
jgi:hypothetical protein